MSGKFTLSILPAWPQCRISHCAVPSHFGSIANDLQWFASWRVFSLFPYHCVSPDLLQLSFREGFFFYFLSQPSQAPSTTDVRQGGKRVPVSEEFGSSLGTHVPLRVHWFCCVICVGGIGWMGGECCQSPTDRLGALGRGVLFPGPASVRVPLGQQKLRRRW